MINTGLPGRMMRVLEEAMQAIETGQTQEGYNILRTARNKMVYEMEQARKREREHDVWKFLIKESID